MLFTRAISILFHPFLIPSYIIFILFHSGSWMEALDSTAKWYMYGVSAIATFLLPLAALFILKRIKWISDMTLTDPKERRIPLMTWSLFALLGAFILLKVSAPIFLALYFNSISIVLLVTAMISFFWNISVYMVYAGALFGVTLSVTFLWMLDTRYWLAAALVMSGLVGYARLKNNKHKPLEIYGGFFLGAVGFFLLTYLL